MIYAGDRGVSRLRQDGAAVAPGRGRMARMRVVRHIGRPDDSIDYWDGE